MPNLFRTISARPVEPKTHSCSEKWRVSGGLGDSLRWIKKLLNLLKHYRWVFPFHDQGIYVGTVMFRYVRHAGKHHDGNIRLYLLHGSGHFTSVDLRHRVIEQNHVNGQGSK